MSEFEMNPTPDVVWDTLHKVDCKDKLEKKGGLTYLSWANAWMILMDNFPQAQYEFLEPEVNAKGEMTVSCRIWIGQHVEHTMWLPVMDYKNKPIANPNMREVSDNKMRCLVKAIAMCGLACYVYAGEDLPKENERSRVNRGRSKSNPETEKAKAQTGGDEPSEKSEPQTQSEPATNDDPPSAANVAETVKETEAAVEAEAQATAEGEGNAGDSGEPEQAEVNIHETVEMTLMEFVNECKSVPDLEKFWKDNVDPLRAMEAEDKPRFANVLNRFKEVKAELEAAQE